MHSSEPNILQLQFLRKVCDFTVYLFVKFATINLEYKSFEFTKIDWAEGLVCALLLVGNGDKALLRFEADADNLGFL